MRARLLKRQRGLGNLLPRLRTEGLQFKRPSLHSQHTQGSLSLQATIDGYGSALLRLQLHNELQSSVDRVRLADSSTSEQAAIANEQATGVSLEAFRSSSLANGECPPATHSRVGDKSSGRIKNGAERRCCHDMYRQSTRPPRHWKGSPTGGSWR